MQLQRSSPSILAFSLMVLWAISLAQLGASYLGAAGFVPIEEVDMGSESPKMNDGMRAQSPSQFYYAWYPETLTVQPGQHVAVPVMFENEEEVFFYGLNGGFDTTILEFQADSFSWDGAAAVLHDLWHRSARSVMPGSWGGWGNRPGCPGVPAGTHLAFTVLLHVKEDAPFGPTVLQMPYPGYSCGLANCDVVETHPPGYDAVMWVNSTVFLRGDVDCDHAVTLADAIYTLRHLYVPEEPAPYCLDAADSNDDGTVDMGDARFIMFYLYVPASPPLPEPFPETGTDPTPDYLGCTSYP